MFKSHFYEFTHARSHEVFPKYWGKEIKEHFQFSLAYRLLVRNAITWGVRGKTQGKWGIFNSRNA